jgi:hypothetical protein
MLTIQQRRALEAAARATTFETGEPLAIGENVWEQDSNIVQLKAGFGDSGVKVGTPVTQQIADEQAEFGTAEANLVWDGGWKNAYVADPAPFNALTPNTDPTTPYVVSSPNAARAGTGPAWKIFDGLAGTQFATVINTNADFSIETGALTIVAYKVLGAVTDPGDSPGDFKLYGFGGGGWEEIDSRTGQTFGTALSPEYRVSSPASYTAYRFVSTESQDGGNTGVRGDVQELYLYAGAIATTDNTVPTLNLVSGTQSFNPAELYAKVDGGAYSKTGLDSKFKIAYSTNGGVSYSSLVDPSTFQALPASTFASLTDLNLKIQPTGAYVINAIRIDTIASSVLSTKTGSMEFEVEGNKTLEITAGGAVLSEGHMAADAFIADVVSYSSGEHTLDFEVEAVFCDTASGEVTVNLPASADEGRRFRFKRITPGANNVVIVAPSDELVEGAASLTLSASGEAADIEYDGSNWWRMG